MQRTLAYLINSKSAALGAWRIPVRFFTDVDGSFGVLHLAVTEEQRMPNFCIQTLIVPYPIEHGHLLVYKPSPELSMQAFYANGGARS
jgi:hypothetical protein